MERFLSVLQLDATRSRWENVFSEFLTGGRVDVLLLSLRKILVLGAQWVLLLHGTEKHIQWPSARNIQSVLCIKSCFRPQLVSTLYSSIIYHLSSILNNHTWTILCSNLTPLNGRKCTSIFWWSGLYLWSFPALEKFVSSLLSPLSLQSVKPAVRSKNHKNKSGILFIISALMDLKVSGAWA